MNPHSYYDSIMHYQDWNFVQQQLDHDFLLVLTIFQFFWYQIIGYSHFNIHITPWWKRFAFCKASQYFTSFMMLFQMVNKSSATGKSSTQLKKRHSTVSTTNTKKVKSNGLLIDIFCRCMFWSFSCCMFQNLCHVCKSIASKYCMLLCQSRKNN